LGKSVETHFVPALAVVRLVIGSSETVKTRGKHRNASCYEIITTGQTNLRLYRRNERGQVGLEQLARCPFSQAGCVAHYTNFVPWFAMNVPMKNRSRKAV
jgi:hypothetical protein